MISIFTSILVVISASFVFSCCATYVVRAISRRIGFVDRPDGLRKIQTEPVALGGGLAVFATICAAAYTGYLLIPSDRVGDLTTSVAVLQFSIILLLTGLIDDSIGMRGKYKLLLQVVAASIITGAGTTISKIDMFGIEFQLGLLGNVFTVLWLIGAINSFNLLDGIDGLAASVGIVLALTIGSIAMLVGSTIMAIACFLTAGALGGFLVFNRAPATIYLGDTGSMFVGGLLGVIAIRCTTKEAAAVAFVAPLAIWAIPIFDSATAVLRRKLTGRSMYATDRGHIHHQLLVRGLSPNLAVLVISGTCMLTSVAAVAGEYLQNPFIGPLAAAITISVLVYSRIFGHSEATLLNHRLMAIGRRIVPGWAMPNGSHASIQFQGTFRWEFFWLPLIESAPRFNLAKIRLNVHLPHCHEDFFSQWASTESLPDHEGWKLRLPLHCDGETIGKVEVHGHDSEDAAIRVSEFVEFFQSLESELYLTINRDILSAKMESSVLDDELDSVETAIVEPQT